MRSLIVAACVAVPALAAQGRPSPAPPPLGAWTPVPELPGMGRPVDTASVAARRRALLARIGRGVVLVPAAHERELERDYVQDNDFRQSNTFFYFTELETQDAWLLLVAGGGAPETVLFLPPRNPLQERWTGLRLGPDSTAVRLSGIPRVLSTDSLDDALAAALFRARPPVRPPRPDDARRAADPRAHLRGARRAEPAPQRGLAAPREGRRRDRAHAEGRRYLRARPHSGDAGGPPGCVGVRDRGGARGGIPEERRRSRGLSVDRRQRAEQHHAPLRRQSAADAGRRPGRGGRGRRVGTVHRRRDAHLPREREVHP